MSGTPWAIQPVVASPVTWMRITTPLAAAYDDVELSAKGPLARRIRWDVLRMR